MTRKQIQKTIYVFLIIFNISVLSANIRAVWVPLWELTSSEDVDRIIEEFKENNITQILAQVRYRGDAGYFPNKYNNFYPNTEKRYFAIKDSIFDPLAYLVKKAHSSDMEVLSWFTTFVITGHKLDNLDSTHVYFTHPEWVTTDFSQQSMNPETFEGAFLDPGIPEVRNYTLSVLLDIVANYDVDGVHLDYIRYTETQFGYNKLAIETYKKEVKYQDAKSWQAWKQDQISKFVKTVYTNVKTISPEIKVTAAVITEIDEAIDRYSQNWLEWIENDYIDAVYLMAYTTSTKKLKKQLTYISNFEMNNKIVVGLRTWNNKNNYPAKEINEKIKLTLKMKFAGYALFSYSGIRQEEYFKSLKIK